MTQITREKISIERIRKLKIVFFLTSIYLAIEVIGGLFTGSLVLLADAGHMLTDVGGLALSLFAINHSRKPRTPKRTYGFYRMEILASLTNSVLLVLISVFVFYEAYRRFFEPPEIHTLPMIIVASVGLVVNFVGLRLFGGHPHKSYHSAHDAKGHESDKEDELENLNIEGARL